MTLASSKGGYWLGKDGLQTQISIRGWGCKCCGECEIDENLIFKINDLRNLIKREIYIDGACRCKAHNAEIGGSKNSMHLSICKAADIRADVPIDVLFFSATKLFPGVGVYFGKHLPFIHVDLKTTRRTNPRFWYRTRNNKYHYYADEYKCYEKYAKHFAKELKELKT